MSCAKLKYLLPATMLLAGCQTFDDKPWYDPLNLQTDMRQRPAKTVQVAPQDTSFALQFIAGTGAVENAERDAAARFLKRRAGAGSDEIYVDFGLIGPALATADRRMTVAEIVTAAGLDPARVMVRENVEGVAADEVNLTVRRYLVTVPGCPDFTLRAGRSFDNQPNSNWGCATATNFGLMVAEPKDIVEGRGETRGDGEALVLGVQRYRAGQTRALQVDDTNTADSYGVSGQSGGGSGGSGGSK